MTDSAIAGILHNIAGMTVFLNPTDGSYLRFGQHKAPKYTTWSENNRAQLISIRQTQNGNRCAQLRSPDPEANPYLAYALMIYAVLDGIENQRALPQPVDEEIWLSGGEMKDEPERLPDNLEKARMEAKKSQLIQKFISSSVIRLYCAK